jgi:endonuclease-3
MSRESKANRKSRALEIVARLERAYPNATTELRWSDPFQLLVATILSAQCTDVVVNQVTERLFRKYRRARDFAAADPAVFEQEIRPTGFFRNKTKSVLGMARMLLDDFGGEVPRTMDELLRLPGVQRKTANVVLQIAFATAAGIVVDTHVDRVSKRLGLVPASVKPPEKIEQVLMDLYPADKWIPFSQALVLHGRYVCVARKPRCPDCVLESVCPKVGVTETSTGAPPHEG